MDTGANQKEPSPLESIRTRTAYTQEEFAVYCQIPLATYRRMLTKSPEAYKMSPQQIVNICRVSGISLEEFFLELGISLEGLKH